MSPLGGGLPPLLSPAAGRGKDSLQLPHNLDSLSSDELLKLLFSGGAQQPQQQPVRRGAPARDLLAERGCYSAVKGVLSHKDADMLNRMEQRLTDAGVDLRGQFHKHS